MSSQEKLKTRYENTLLKNQQGEDEDVLMLPPDARETLMGAIAQSLGKKWDVAIKQMESVRDTLVASTSSAPPSQDSENLKKAEQETLH